MDKIENIVEEIARLNLNERHDFVEKLTDKWPDMAISLSNSIGLQTMINREEANQNS